LFPALLLAALSLGVFAVAHAQEAEQPQQASMQVAAERFVKPFAQFVPASAKSADLRRGFEYDRNNCAGRFHMSPNTCSGDSNLPEDLSTHFSQSPQQTTTQPAFTPLTAGQKMSRAGRSAFLRPTPYAFSIFNAAITQWNEDSQPHKTTEDEVADAGSRAARNFATSTTRTIFASGIYPVLFKQDPRYERSPRKGFAPRTLHALSRVFITRDDEGNHEPNYSRLAGIMTASALANIWERSTPGHDRIGTDATLRRFVKRIGNEALINIVFREFWPDIMKIFRR
jgi:hypothetical protein